MRGNKSATEWSPVQVPLDRRVIFICSEPPTGFEPEDGLQSLHYTEGMIQPLKDAWMDAIRSATDLMYRSNEEIEELLDKEEEEELSQSQAGEESAS